MRHPGRDVQESGGWVSLDLGEESELEIYIKEWTVYTGL